MKYKLFIVFVLIIVISEFSFAQSSSFNLIGAGARARGMGGAFIGVADDATAVSWNPAGLSKLEVSEASIVGLFESRSVSTDLDIDTDAYSSSHFNLNFVSAAYPLSVGERNIVAALAFQKVIDLYSKYDGADYSEERTGGVNAITPSIGVQLTPTISIGAAINIFTGKTDYTSEDKFGFSGTTEAEYNYSGTNINIGGLFDFDKFRFGAVFKTPFGLTEEESDLDYDMTIHMPQMIGFGTSYSFTENLTMAADFEMRSYSDTEFENNTSGNKVNAEWQDINQLRLGVEYLLMSGTNILPLRAGIATTPSLFTDMNDDQITGVNLTAGVGIIMGNINLDLGLEYNTFPYEITNEFGEKYDYSEDYVRFVISGVFHFGQ